MVRWCAPEVLLSHVISSASDVWSYGVVVWELLSLGMQPYCGWSDEQVIRAVSAGFILPMPSVRHVSRSLLLCEIFFTVGSTLHGVS